MEMEFSAVISTNQNLSELANPDFGYSHNKNPEKKIILLIEDDVMILELLHEVLTQAGYAVLIARNATDGLEQFKSNKKNIFCIVLDYEIPGMHPSRLLEKISEIDSDVKIVISSGYSQNIVIQEIPSANISCYFAKPYDPMSLVSELKKL